MFDADCVTPGGERLGVSFWNLKADLISGLFEVMQFSAPAWKQSSFLLQNTSLTVQNPYIYMCVYMLSLKYRKNFGYSVDVLSLRCQQKKRITDFP